MVPNPMTHTEVAVAVWRKWRFRGGYWVDSRNVEISGFYGLFA